jgi:hypothetical protein
MHVALLLLLPLLLQVTKCLRKLSRLSPAAIMKKYSYPSLDMAAALHQRANDMLHNGFEWTLNYGWPQNPSPTRCIAAVFMLNDTFLSPVEPAYSVCVWLDW